ncbi:GntR family transcriptional regulator [Actinoplanes sp. DH11]|uniref:GntR family transcriptional regulator n=1 Tax=Actinoplanes sp. DH11 TaxID=2857011 RepID=UPI001E4C24AE|nr:GntR family transcriptional regulator [Actinoplanes sp. DH11]
MTGRPLEPAPAKYAHIADSLRSRINNGVHPPGTMLPSEAQLVREFAASRSTVVRALEYLRQLGYLEGVQGKGRMVLGTPVPRRPVPPRRVHVALHASELANATLLGAGRAPASPRIAAVLEIAVGELVIARQRTMFDSETEWPLLSTVYMPAVAAEGTGFGASDLLREGALDHLERRRRIRAADVVERMNLRTALPREATSLGLDRNASTLASLLVVRNAAQQALLVIEQVMPVPPHGIEEVFALAHA